jgi:hypothetical protein
MEFINKDKFENIILNMKIKLFVANLGEEKMSQLIKYLMTKISFKLIHKKLNLNDEIFTYEWMKSDVFNEADDKLLETIYNDSIKIIGI